MKELINKFKKLDQTKRIVILFITISFVFIAGFSIYNGISGNYQNGNTAQVTQVKDTKEKNTKKNKEEKQESKEDTNTQQEETTKQEDNTKKEENNTQESTTKKDDSSKQETKNETSKSTNQSTASTSTTESTGSTQGSSNSNQSSNTTSNNTSNNTNASQSQTNSKITVSVQVIGMGDTMMASTMSVDKNSNVLSVLKELASKNGKEVAGSDYYVSGIGGLYEKQHGSGSGWMYSVNGVTPMKAAINYTLKDSDSVVWYYVNYN